MNNFKLLKGYNIKPNQTRVQLIKEFIQTMRRPRIESSRIPEQYIVPERYNHNVEIGTV